MGRPRSPNPSKDALRMRAYRARKKAGLLVSRPSVPELPPSPVPEPTPERTFVPPIEETVERTSASSVERTTGETISGPGGRALPMPIEFEQTVLGGARPSPAPSSPSPSPNDNLPEWQRPGFRGYSCPECLKGAYVEPELLRKHMVVVHAYRDRGDGIPVPTQKSLSRVPPRPSPERSSKPVESPWEKVPDWEPVEPIKPSQAELAAEGWEPVPSKPTKRELAARGWTRVTGEDLIAEGYEPVEL